MRFSTTSIVALMASALLFAAGCGDNGDDEEPGDEADAVADTSPEPDTGMDTGMDADEDADPMDVEEDIGNDATDGGQDADPDTMEDTDGEMATIRNLRTSTEVEELGVGDSLEGTRTIEDVVVTGVDGSGDSVSGFFAQDSSGDPEDSGIWVFLGNAADDVTVPTIEQGTVVDVEGTVTNYDNQGAASEGGLLEIHEVASITEVEQGAELPSPVEISDASTLAPGESNAETYESVLIEVSDVTVAELPEGIEGGAWPNEHGETLLESGLRFGTTLYDYTGDFSPSAGDTYSSIVGPLNFGFDKTILAPRNADDITAAE